MLRSLMASRCVILLSVVLGVSGCQDAFVERAVAVSCFALIASHTACKSVCLSVLRDTSPPLNKSSWINETYPPWTQSVVFSLISTPLCGVTSSNFAVPENEQNRYRCQPNRTNYGKAILNVLLMTFESLYSISRDRKLCERLHDSIHGREINENKQHKSNPVCKKNSHNRSLQ